MRSADIEQGITFGPFRMPHLGEHVDERFRRAFCSYLAQQVMPSLDGEIVRVEGRVFSHYDQPQFVHLAEVRCRYYYQIAFSCRSGVEEAWGELDYDPCTASWTPSRTKPPCVRTLTEKRKVRALCQSHRHPPTRPADCPRCHSKEVAEIVYGLLPHPERFQEELDSGRIVRGGCWAWDESQQWRCLLCKHEWGLTGYALALRELENQERQEGEG
jgi:hypothetical protein